MGKLGFGLAVSCAMASCAIAAILVSRRVKRRRKWNRVVGVLKELYPSLLQPLIMWPLRSKSVDQQVGTVTALNFCSALRPPLLKLTQELVNFLQEALHIVEAGETVWVVMRLVCHYNRALHNSYCLGYKWSWTNYRKG